VFAGKGFGNVPSSKGEPPEKTYAESARAPIRDLIDSEAAMHNFFSAREEWLPIFRSLAVDESCAAMNFLETLETDIDFHEESKPWRRLPTQPTDESEREHLSAFLDSMQQSLLDIPVDEAVKEDENDMQFVEEGRRLLALTRFHVLQGNHGGSVESNDALFACCWSELMELSSKAEEHTGSLIILPEYEIHDLRRFADMNLQRPLEWLGIHADFEVASMERGSPAIRLLYKLNDIPTDTYLEEEQGE